LPTPTYKALANITLASTSATVSFSNIPATYRDLVLVVNRVTGTINTPYIRFNSDTGSNYSEQWLQYSGGSSASSGTGTSLVYSNTALGVAIIEILDYSATDKHKTTITRWTENPIGIVQIRTARWANTAAVTSLTLGVASGSYPAEMTFSLYGIVS
jgi:hypothetical protein